MYVLNTEKEKENKVIIYKKALRKLFFFLKPYTHTHQYINFKYKQQKNVNILFNIIFI